MPKLIKLIYLELTNYRNIPHAEFMFDREDSKIVGENRIGKTNTLEAIAYLLTDKLLNGSSDIASIKPIGNTKATVSVKATFSIDDPESAERKEITIMKEYGELWVKTRGTTEKVMKGHFTNYYYNGIKQATIKDYDKLFSEDFGIKQDPSVAVDYVRMVSDPFYLANLGEGLEWKNLRAFIIKLVGDVSDEDVFAKEPALSKIRADLQRAGGRIDQLRKQFSQQKKEVEDQIIGDESKINFLEKTERPTDDEVAVARRAIQEHDDNIAALKASNGEDAQSRIIKDKIAVAQSNLLKLIDEQSKHKSPAEIEFESIQTDREAISAEKQKVLSEKNKATYEVTDLERLISRKKSEVEECSRFRENLLKQLRETDAAIKNPDVATVCPTCGRPLEEADVQKAKSSVVSNLESKKASLITTGKENKEKMILAQQAISDAEEKIASIEQRIKDADAKYDDLVAKDKELAASAEEVRATMSEKRDTPEIAALRLEIEKLKQDLIEAQNSFQQGQNSANEAILAEEEAKKSFQTAIDSYNYWLRQQEELGKAEDEKAKHEKYLIDIEQKAELVNRYVYVKLKMLDENVSKVFGNIKFQLISENINGGFDPVCKAYIYDPVKDESTKALWKSGSKSERIATGIAIAERVKKALSIPSLPYLFDEGGEVSLDTFKNRLITDAQLICVEVKDNVMSPTIVKI